MSEYAIKLRTKKSPVNSMLDNKAKEVFYSTAKRLDEVKKHKKLYIALQLLVNVVMIVIVSFLMMHIALASDGIYTDTDLLSVLQDDSVTGSVRLGKKYSKWILWGTKTIISITGICLICYNLIQIAATLTYLSYPTWFDFVNDVQNGGGGGQPFSTQGVIGINQGQGFDIKSVSLSNTISYYIAKICIDVKAWSDTEAYDTGEIMTPLEYARESMIKFIIFILLGAMLVSGSLSRIASNIASGGLVVADFVEQLDISGKVRGVLEADRDYVFIFDDTVQGRNKKSMCEKMYAVVKDAVPDDRTSDFLQSAGQAIYSKVNSLVIPTEVVQGGWDNPTFACKVVRVANEPDNIAEGAFKHEKGGTDKVAKFSIKPLIENTKTVPTKKIGWILVQVSGESAYETRTSKTVAKP